MYMFVYTESIIFIYISKQAVLNCKILFMWRVFCSPEMYMQNNQWEHGFWYRYR